MQIEYGTEVVDKNGVVLGTVDYVVRNAWTGEISKFMVRQKQFDENLFFSPEDVLEVAESRFRLSVSREELGYKSEE